MIRANLLAVFMAVMATSAAVAAADEEPTVHVRLVSEQSALVRGQTQRLGIHLRHEPHWHTYWLNPGDSGIPTSIAWSLPEGFAAGSIAWPAPTRFDVDGLYNFGFEGELVLPVSVRVPESAGEGPVRISAVVKWLACKEVCIPGKAALDLELPVVDADAPLDPSIAPLFADATARQPKPVGWPARAVSEGDAIVFRIDADKLPAHASLDAFVEDRRVVAHGAPELVREGSSLVVRFTRSEYFSTAPERLGLVLVAKGTPDAWRLVVPFQPERS